MNGLSVVRPQIQAMSNDSLARVEALEECMLDLPQLELTTEHVIHGGMYARTIVIPAGVAITGVLIEANIDAPVRRRLAAPGVPPSSGLVAQTIDRCNASANFGTSQLFIRHWGQRALLENTGVGGTVDSYHEGRYLYVYSASPVSIELPFFEDPNLGSTSNLLAELIYGRLTVMAVMHR